MKEEQGIGESYELVKQSMEVIQIVDILTGAHIQQTDEEYQGSLTMDELEPILNGMRKLEEAISK